MQSTSDIKVVHASTGVALQARRLEASNTPSTRSDGLPTRQVDIDRRIEIAVMVAGTLRAVPFPHREGEAAQNMPADMAPLRGWVEPVDQPDLPPIPLAFILQHPPEHAQGNIRQGLGQAMVLNHPMHKQVLDADPTELANQGSGRLIQGILPRIRNLLLHPGNANALPHPPFTAFFPPGKNPLRPTQSALILGRMLRVADPLPIRNGGQTVDPQVHPTGQSRGRQLGKSFFQTKGNKIPSARFLRHRHRGGQGRKSPAPNHPKAAKPSQLQTRILGIIPPKLERRSGILRTLPVPLLLKPRIRTLLVEKANKRIVQMPQGLLRRDTRDFVQPLCLLLPLPPRQLRRRSIVTNLFLPLKPRIGSEPQTPVVDIPATPEYPPKHICLGMRRIKPEPVANLHT